MWNENEIDMEELEARLYGQVHHPTTEDFAYPSFNNIPNSNKQESSMNTYGRYFNESRRREQMCNFKNGYRESTYFKNPESNVNFQHSVNYQTVPNFYNPMGYVPEIAVNNIVVLPSPPTHIFTQPQLAHQDISKTKKRQKQREKRRAKRAEMRELLRESTKTFREHRLINKSVNSLNTNQNDCEIIEAKKDEIICVSESDGSDCEIADVQELPIVLSSDDEGTNKTLFSSDVKYEMINNGNIVDNVNNTYQANKEGTDKKDGNINNGSVNDTEQSHLEIKPSVVVSSSEYLEKGTDIKGVVETKPISLETSNDDVILVELKPDDVIIISGDDTQSLCEEKRNDSSGSFDANIVPSPTLTNKEFSYRPGTPESTNDFLENSFNESNDVNLNASNTQCLNIQKRGSDVCETESSTSASDIEGPCRNSTFIEQEFDVPSENAFSELNLDSFTNYIACGNKNTKGMLTHENLKNLESNANSATKENRNKDIVERNSSDSSSESDYEDNKIKLIENRPKTKRRLSLKSRTSSDNDCYIIEHSFNELKKNLGNTSTPLPNLSPITSDEEFDNCKKNKKTNENSETKNKKIQKEKSLPLETSSSGEKRKYPKEIEEYVKAKRSKENENLIKSKKMIKKKFSDSSDELSEIEITHSANNEISVELLNVDTPVELSSVKQSSEAPQQKPVRFQDYWNEDMKKFYLESWGHEDFTVEQAQKNMSDSPDMWKIDPSDRSYIKMSPRGPRCNRCYEHGHKAMNCKARPKPIKCSTCGAAGHAYTRCPKSICTSCGRRNYCLTNYCSRCVDLRYIKCKICSQYGHLDRHCPDLWRRYHLTTKSGPLQKPRDLKLKSPKNRWCSGCASNGHFEYECHYYNRTHAATDPTICSYDDVYDKNNSTTKQTQTQTSNNSGRNNSYINNVSPWIVANIQNPYIQNQNFRQERGINQSFLQQLPMFQSVPSIFTLQQGSNVFCQNSNMMFANQFVPQNIGSNVFHQNQQLTNSPLKNFTPKANQQQAMDDKLSKHYLNIKGGKGEGLVSQEGVKFIKELSDTSKGPCQQMVNVKKKILDFIDSYIPPPVSLMEIFQGKSFSLKVLKESLAYLDNPNVNWNSTMTALFRKIKTVQCNIDKSQDTKETSELQNKLNMRYIALNAVIIGKLRIQQGAKHMETLKNCNKAKHFKSEQFKMLKESYEYVFKNSTKLNISYDSLISNLPLNIGLEDEIKNSFESAVKLCEKNNFPELLVKMKMVYKLVVHSKYQQKNVSRFKRLYDTIKNKNHQVNADKQNT